MEVEGGLNVSVVLSEGELVSAVSLEISHFDLSACTSLYHIPYVV